MYCATCVQWSIAAPMLLSAARMGRGASLAANKRGVKPTASCACVQCQKGPKVEAKETY
jgi:hypothetical protein